ncbi:hypothetical protein [Leadbettera azotonutricia]|nr:hypothetical protein [Leadbettera azotonutricia]
MEQLKMVPMKSNHPNWIWNRSDTHIFLKVPEAHDAFATVVEPGNSFSPGPGSYGVSTWVTVDNKLYAPEKIDLKEILWEFEDKKYPISHALWDTGDIKIDSSLFTWQNGDIIDYRDYFRVKLSNNGKVSKRIKFDLVIRSFGAAGGPIGKLSEKDGIIYINGAALVYAETKGKFGAVSYAENKKDISEYLQNNQFPETKEVEDSEKWASGSLRYEFDLDVGVEKIFDFAFHLHAECDLYSWLKQLTFPIEFDMKKQDLIRKWNGLTKSELHVPDERVYETFHAQINHLYMASGLNAPHISPITYPTWWMRDSAYICTTLDQCGLHDFAGRSAHTAGRYNVSAPFGPEADLQGCRIWVISEHWLLTRNKKFLDDNYSYITENAEEILLMINADKPLRFYCESFNHQTINWPEVVYSCAPAENGMAKGRMDFVNRDFYCNSFCYLGLRRAEMCAKELDKTDDEKRYGESAAKLRKAMLDYVPGHFTRMAGFSKAIGSFVGEELIYTHHDSCTTFYPGTWGDLNNKELLDAYENYWNKYNCPNGKPFHEALWTYMEIGDLRNRLILGQRERVWSVLDYYFKIQNSPGLYTWHESNKDENSLFLAWEKVRGWEKAPFVTPHGWTGSLMLGMMRDIMVREDDRGNIYLGSGVPKSWMDKPFSIDNFPTYYGVISYSYTPKDKKVKVHLNKTSECKIISCFLGDVNIEIVS